MVMLNEAFPSKWLKSEDLQGREAHVVIASVNVEKVGNDNKLVMFFRGKQKGMICNKTNAQRIALAYGEDTNGWVGQPITLYAEMVDFQGKATWGLRVKVARQVDPQFIAARQHVAAHLNGAGAVQQPPPAYQQQPAQTHMGGGDLDDSIPFGPCKD